MSKKTSAFFESTKKETAKVAVKKEKKIKAFKHKNISEALFAFQGEALVLPRNGEGKASSGKTYKYVTLDDLINFARPLLQKHGLVFTQLVQSDKMETRLTHASTDTFVSSIINLGAPNQMQDYGGRITYAKRYALSAILGLSAEEDTDAVPVAVGLAGLIGANLAAGISAVAPGFNLTKKAEENATLNAPYKAENMGAVGAVKETTGIVPKSEPFKLAKSAIDTAFSEEALYEIQEKINRSVKLSTEEKAELIELLKARETEVAGTIR